MSAGLACPYREEHFAYWWVRFYKCNHSAFSGYQFTLSDYSEVVCEGCGGNRWRTTAAYVEQLPRSAPALPAGFVIPDVVARIAARRR